MDRNNRPRGRQKNLSGRSGRVFRRGSGLGTGKVGSGSRPGGGLGSGGAERPALKSDGRRRPLFMPRGFSSGGMRGSRSPLMYIILVVIVLLAGGGGGLNALMDSAYVENGSYGNAGNAYDSSLGGSYGSSSHSGAAGGGSELSGLFEDYASQFGGSGSGSYANLFGTTGGTSGGWHSDSANTAQLNTAVAPGARAKYTSLLGNGKDTVTIMVYMCGTDLESRSGMATSDMQEMIAADLSDQVNLLIYTGGCTNWKNNVVSTATNQIYRVVDGGLERLVSNAGDLSMTDPDTLTEYIQWCAENFPANRNGLILWDHGGGSLSGYGYDQKHQRSGSMSLAGINTALKNAGVKFDFIGFDACLMATMETALMLGDYADYLIASEETEPGVGWYYTRWLTALSENTSMPTVTLGKQIVDDFVETCAQKCPGQQTTLSVIDLAELESTVPEKLSAFANATTELIRSDNYQTVSNARYHTREFAKSTGIDQVDLVHLAKNMNSKEGEALADALLGAVKYNRTSRNMTNAYGISIYFPYRKTAAVDQAVHTYRQIGMDADYARCIQNFASLQLSGQAAAGGSNSPLSSLLGSPSTNELASLFSDSSSYGSDSLSGLFGGSGSGGQLTSGDALSSLLNELLSGGARSMPGMDTDNTAFLEESALDMDSAAAYLSENRFDAAQLVWSENADGQLRIDLPEEQWALVQNLDLNLFYDDGTGFIDLGLDNVFAFDDEGQLLGETDGSWLAINGQPVAYYHEDTVDDGEHYTITGYVPAMLNGARVKLMLVFDDAHPNGYIAGARSDYRNGETETQAKGMSALVPGDKLDFLCDYYAYDGTYEDSYYLGEQLTVTEDMEISNVYIGDDALQPTYRFTDIYNQHYWTPVLP